MIFIKQDIYCFIFYEINVESSKNTPCHFYIQRDKYMLRKTILALSVISASFCAFSEVQNVDKTSYAIGSMMGKDLSEKLKSTAETGIVLNKEMLAKGFVDSLNGLSTMKEEDALALLKALDESIQEVQSEASKVHSSENKQAGKTFQSEYSDKYADAQMTSSGLQYRVIKKGQGNKPSATSLVKVHYRGTLINGKKFDDSFERGQPAEFRLDGVIKGWTEGLQLMTEGSVYELVIPSDLAYGDQGTPDIAPGSTLVFHVELIEVK